MDWLRRTLKANSKPSHSISEKLDWSKRLNVLLLIALFFTVFLRPWLSNGGLGQQAVLVTGGPGTPPTATPSISGSSTWATKVSSVLQTDPDVLAALASALASSGPGGLEFPDINTPKFTAFLALFGLNQTLPPQIKRVVVDIGWQRMGEYDGSSHTLHVVS